REEQLKILGQMKDSDIDYSDIAATDAEFWQEATVEAARWMVSRERPIAREGQFMNFPYLAAQCRK
ncbi:MAG: hypothetical protein ACKPA9_30180, partial [Microcystis sp.]